MCGSLIAPSVWQKGELLALGLLGSSLVLLAIMHLLIAVMIQNKEIKS